jgi:hypothetical protein
MPPERNHARDAHIWELYVNGHSQPALAKQFGLSHQRISQIVQSFRDAIKPEDKAEIVVRSFGQLHWMERELHALAASPPIPAYSNGRPIVTSVDPDTGDDVVAEDHSHRVTAMRELRATNESIRKLTGADAKVESSVTVQTSPELSALVEQARARRLAREEPEDGAA